MAGKTPAAKTTAAKTTAVKTTAAKTTAAKTTAAKTTAAKTTAAKTTAAKAVPENKKAELKAAVHFQFEGRDVVAKDVLDEAVKAFKSTHKDVEVKDIQLYIVAEEGAAYYVVNGEASDDYKIIL